MEVLTTMEQKTPIASSMIYKLSQRELKYTALLTACPCAVLLKYT
jgi:hypothetical protein